jgi:hypothetical protein
MGFLSWWFSMGYLGRNALEAGSLTSAQMKVQV